MTAITRRLGQEREILIGCAQVVGAALLLALSARAAIYLPFTPVPIALHPTVAVMLGIVLGARRAALAVLLYLLQGAIGLPVFSGGGGIAYLCGPTGGYLLGFLPAAFVAGWIAKNSSLSRGRLVIAAALGHAFIYLFGVLLLAQYVGWSRVFMAGVAPFVPGCILKTLILAGLTPRQLIRA